MHPDGYRFACVLFPKLSGPALDELAADIFKGAFSSQPIPRHRLRGVRRC
jgi:hypothetical protein